MIQFTIRTSLIIVAILAINLVPRKTITRWEVTSGGMVPFHKDLARVSVRRGFPLAFHVSSQDYELAANGELLDVYTPGPFTFPGIPSAWERCKPPLYLAANVVICLAALTCCRYIARFMLRRPTHAR
jgi:hypothetical protein